VREQWAWCWARANALVWTPAMERCATKAMHYIKARAMTAKATRERMLS
jgi:hypothetical protein